MNLFALDGRTAAAGKRLLFVAVVRAVVASSCDDVATGNWPKLLLLLLTRLFEAINDGRPPRTPDEPPNEPVNLLIVGADVVVGLKLLVLKLKLESL